MPRPPSEIQESQQQQPLAGVWVIVAPVPGLPSTAVGGVVDFDIHWAGRQMTPAEEWLLNQHPECLAYDGPSESQPKPIPERKDALPASPRRGRAERGSLRRVE